MSNFLNYFLKDYSVYSIEIQKKVKALLIGSLIMSISCLIPFFVDTFIRKNLVTGIIYLFVITIFLLSIYLIKKHKYDMATYLLTLTSPILITVINIFVSIDSKNVLEIYRLATMLFICICLLVLVSKNKNQIILFCILSVICIVSYSVIKINLLGLWSISDSISEVIGANT
ncbi:MAG TPA: hypothetical protein PK771_10765, partial [Spirochaetota bacterium]|nr:hypothetical protein [Spirochaetota bacterium]